VEYFSQIGPALPGLRDRSGLTAQERFRLGLKGWGKTLMTRGDPCQAVEQFQLSLAIGPDAEIDQLLTEAYTACQGGEEEAPAEGEPQLTPSEVLPPPAGTLVPPTEAPPPVEETPYPAPNP
jgi:hypothetical protein